MLKNNFDKLLFRQKIQLYFLIPIFFVIIFIVLQEQFFIDAKKMLPQKQQFSIQSLSDKIVVKNNKEIIDYIETELAKYKIFVQSITTSNQTISLSIKSSFDSMIQFLYTLEQHLVIEEFFLEKLDANTTNIKSRIVFLNHYFANPNQRDVVLNDIKNPYEIESRIPIQKEQNKVKEKLQVKSIQIDAIMLNEVFIEGDWYTIGDIVQDNKIVKIEPTLIKLLNQTTKNIKVIRLESDE